MRACGICGLEIKGIMQTIRMIVHYCHHDDAGPTDDITHLKRNGKRVMIIGDDIEWLLDEWERLGYTVEYVVVRE